MRSDLDQLIATRPFSAIVVFAGEDPSPQLEYLIGRVGITRGAAIKVPDHDPILVVGPMETDEAAHTGLAVHSFYDFDLAEIQQAHSDELQTQAHFWLNVFGKLGVPTGQIAIYGGMPPHQTLALSQTINSLQSDYQWVGEWGVTIFDEASLTKDADELRRMRAVAEKTSAVVRETREFIASHRANPDEIVIQADGTPLTVGDVKRFVRKALLDRNLDERDMIFAQGRDGAFPHSRGQDQDVLRLGEAIVFDLFPYERGGGYFHDMTRTWCIGYAPEHIRQAYEQVITAIDIAVELIVPNRPIREVQEAVQTHFEELGHATARSHPGTQTGYVHSLGHGIGLQVHEGYVISHRDQRHQFTHGNVFTIEPGLYNPDQAFGVRVEDTVYLAPNGELEILTDIPRDLILPLRG
ncbi:MAG: aminopeptidase P family protein [Anaerolineae bacterium]|nr:aminopeptidase P family protein [Anaerolineae bacterium]